MNIVNQLARSRFAGIFPRHLRSGFRRIFGSIGLYDERPGRLGLKAIYDDDVFVVSYPKSGNTWVRFLLANMINPGEIITFRNIDSYVVDLHKSRDKVHEMRRPRFIKSHKPLFDCYPKMIYVFRDGRDVMTSYYYYIVGRGEFEGGFEEFVFGGWRTSFGTWEDHVLAASRFAASNSQRVLMLRYEDMLLDPIAAARQIACFCRLPVTDEIIRQAVERCEFNRLQKTEREHGQEVEGVRKYQFFRAGTSGQWQDAFSEEGLVKFYEKAGDALQKLGYLSRGV